MAVMTRDSWTDERLDDLNSKVDKVDQRLQAGFADNHSEFRAIRTETRNEFRAVRTEMNQQFEAVRAENAAQMRMMVQLFAMMMVGILGTIATVIVQG
jgi:hypothetical protein